jgi:hypothetical protein
VRRGERTDRQNRYEQQKQSRDELTGSRLEGPQGCLADKLGQSGHLSPANADQDQQEKDDRIWLQEACQSQPEHTGTNRAEAEQNGDREFLGDCVETQVKEPANRTPAAKRAGYEPRRKQKLEDPIQQSKRARVVIARPANLNVGVDGCSADQDSGNKSDAAPGISAPFHYYFFGHIAMDAVPDEGQIWSSFIGISSSCWKLRGAFLESEARTEALRTRYGSK